MAHLIDKDALVAEIDERIKAWKEYYDEMHDAECHELASGAYLRIDELKDFKKFLDTLDVKEVQEQASENLKEKLPISNSLTEEGLFTFEDGSQAIITEIG